MDDTREKWLHRAMPVMMAWLKDAGCKDFPVPHLSMGIPQKGLGQNKRTIGECWPAEVTKTGERCVIFISPLLKEPVQILGTLLHELIHASDNCKSKHRGHFKQVAMAVGMTGKMTATEPGPQLLTALEKLSKDLGELPHDAMVNFTKKAHKRSRVKYACSTCGDCVQAKKDWHAVHLCDGQPVGGKGKTGEYLPENGEDEDGLDL